MVGGEAGPPASTEPARLSPDAKPMADGRERCRAGVEHSCVVEDEVLGKFLVW